MIKEIGEAFQQKDYQKAELLLNEFKEKESENPWFQYYQACLEESKNNLDQAEQSYLKILKNSINPNPQLFSKIRNGIDRIKKLKTTQNQQKIEEFKEIPNSQEFAVLILEPIAAEDKKIAAQKMAEIMQIDLYSARLQIPSRGLKFYRSGSLGELKYYESQLKEASIPCFCFSIKDLEQISVYQAKYVESVSPELIFVCEDKLKNQETITIKWSDINSRIKAVLPLFESSVHVGRQGKLERKTTTLDYVQFYDLHLNNRKMILRFNEQNYQFDKGINFVVDEKNTTKGKWERLWQIFLEEIPDIAVWSNFTLFGEGVVQFPEMLKKIESQVNLFRREETPWDAAFQLYSGLIFLKNI